jgi:hypothetical protein
MNDSKKEEKMIELYPGDAVMFDGDVIHAGDGWRGKARERVFLYVANGQSKAPKIQVREKNGDKKLVVSVRLLVRPYTSSQLVLELLVVYKIILFRVFFSFMVYLRTVQVHQRTR